MILAGSTIQEPKQVSFTTIGVSAKSPNDPAVIPRCFVLQWQKRGDMFFLPRGR